MTSSQVDSLSAATGGAIDHQQQAVHLQGLNQPPASEPCLQADSAAVPTQQHPIPTGWKDTEWTQLVSDVQCVLNGGDLDKENFEAIKALLQEVRVKFISMMNHQDQYSISLLVPQLAMCMS